MLRENIPSQFIGSSDDTRVLSISTEVSGVRDRSKGFLTGSGVRK